MDNPKKESKNWLKEIIPKKEGGKSPPSKTKWMIIAAAMGVLIMLLGDQFVKKEEATTVFLQEEEQPSVETFGPKKEKQATTIHDYETQYENELKEALNEMAGVSNVTVVVNVEATERKVLEKNTSLSKQETSETDKQGGKREIEENTAEEELVIVNNGEKEQPIVLETKKPEIRGVLVVAEGVQNIQVKKWVIESVTRVLDVPSHRVAVMPKKNKGES